MKKSGKAKLLSLFICFAMLLGILPYAQVVAAEDTYTIHFNANGGEGEMHDQIITQTWGKEIALHLNKFTREGYMFVGWTKDTPDWTPQYKNEPGEDRGKPVGLIPDGYKAYYWSDFKEDMEEVTYYAQWDKYYTVHFDANVPESEYTGEEKDRQFIYGADSWLSRCRFKREGFVFTAWNTEPDGTGTSIEDLTWVNNLAGPGEEITLYAQWRPEGDITATFVFDGNGGSGSMEPLLAPYGEKVKLPANTFTRAGYKFYRWASNPDGNGWSFRDQAEIEYGSYGGKESKTITLYAQWVSDKCHFVTVENGSAIPRAAEPGTEIALTAKKPQGQDLFFVKWEVTKGEIAIADSEAEETTFVMPDEDVTVKAVYEPIKKIESLELKTEGYHFGAAVKDATVTVTTPGVEVESVTWLELNLNTGKLEETTYPYFWKNITYRVEVFLKVKKGYSAHGLKIEQVTIDGETPSYFDNPYKFFDIVYPDTMRVLHEMDELKSEDEDAPILEELAVERTSDSKATVVFNSNEAGKYYFEIRDHGADEPYVMVGEGGTECVVGRNTLQLKELTAGAKDIYLVARDAYGNTSSKLKIEIPAYVYVPTTPATGDNSGILHWTLITIAALTFATILLITDKRRKFNK